MIDDEWQEDGQPDEGTPDPQPPSPEDETQLPEMGTDDAAPDSGPDLSDFDQTNELLQDVAADETSDEAPDAPPEPDVPELSTPDDIGFEGELPTGAELDRAPDFSAFDANSRRTSAVARAERAPQPRQNRHPDFASQKADDIDDFNNDGGLGGEDDDGGGGKDAPDVMDLGGRVVESMSNAIADLRRRLEAVESALERERL